MSAVPSSADGLGAGINRSRPHLPSGPWAGVTRRPRRCRDRSLPPRSRVEPPSAPKTGATSIKTMVHGKTVVKRAIVVFVTTGASRVGGTGRPREGDGRGPRSWTAPSVGRRAICKLRDSSRNSVVPIMTGGSLSERHAPASDGLGASPSRERSGRGSCRPARRPSRNALF